MRKWWNRVKPAIQIWLTKHPRINCVQRFLRRITNIQYVKSVIHLDQELAKRDNPHWFNPACIYFEKLGKRNPDSLIYVFKEVEAIGGFFAQHRRLLLALRFADQYNMKPVVYFGKDYRYYENQPINGTKNGFEYYFEPTSDVTYESALVSQKVVFFAPCHLKVDATKEFSFYNPSMEEIRVSAEMQKKYIRVRSDLEEEILSDIAALFQGKKTIGIHVRGTDFRLGLKNHPIPIDIAEHFKIVRIAFQEYGFEQVFVATDEEATIAMVESEFGDKTVFYKDVFRSDEETAAQYKDSNRTLHKYNMGVEVLRDMLTLASCEGLTAGLSQVSICAQITKLSWDKEYEILKIMDKGLFKEDSTKAKKVINQYKKDGRIPNSV